MKITSGLHSKYRFLYWVAFILCLIVIWYLVSILSPIVVSYGDSVQYCDPKSVNSIAEKMYEVLTDHPLRQQLINAGRQRLSLYTWKRTAKIALDQYIESTS